MSKTEHDNKSCDARITTALDALEEEFKAFIVVVRLDDGTYRLVSSGVKGDPKLRQLQELWAQAK